MSNNIVELRAREDHPRRGYLTNDATLAAEAEVLAYALAPGSSVLDEPAVASLRPEEFSTVEHETIWRAILDLDAAGSPHDTAAVLGRLPKGSRASSVAVEVDAVRIVNLDTAAYHAETIRDAAGQRHATSVLRAAAADADRPGFDPRAILARLADRAGDLGEYDTTAQLVARRADALRIERDARRLVARDGLPPSRPLLMGLLDDLDVDEEAPIHLVDGLIVDGGSLLIAAQAKAGKTTLLLNLVRSLITGEPFLGRFEVTRPLRGRVGFVNAELTAAQFKRWAREGGILGGGRVFAAHLAETGCADMLGDVERRAELAASIRAADVEVLVVDPFAAVCGIVDPNDNGAVRSWLNDLGTFAREECGASTVILTHHAGHNGERVRGASAFLDWCSSHVTLTRDEDETRYVKAAGRDVFVEEDRLEYDVATRTLTLTGTGGRKAKRGEGRAARQASAVESFVRRHPGSTVGEIERGVRAERAEDSTRPSFSANDVSRTVAALASGGLVRVEDGGAGRGKRVFSLAP